MQGDLLSSKCPEKVCISLIGCERVHVHMNASGRVVGAPPQLNILRHCDYVQSLGESISDLQLTPRLIHSALDER